MPITSFDDNLKFFYFFCRFEVAFVDDGRVVCFEPQAFLHGGLRVDVRVESVRLGGSGRAKMAIIVVSETGYLYERVG